MSHNANDYQKPLYYLVDEFIQYWSDHNSPTYGSEFYTALFDEFCEETDLNPQQKLDVFVWLFERQTELGAVIP